jgi:transcriptional regulator with XRE-family HTH domain
VIRLSRGVELLNNGEGLLGTSSATVGGVAALEGGRVNEPLRRFLLQARLREVDVAARLGVDPKTVRRWLSGRVPYPHNRAAIADLLGVDEADLWPGASGTLTARMRPDELGAVYPHRWAVPREVWIRFFGSAEREIGILADSALFLAEDREVLRLLAEKWRAGVNIRIALGDPESSHVGQRGEEDVGDAMPAQVRKALGLYRSVAESGNVEIRLHQAVLYNSIYCADEQLLVNQHAYGIPAAHAPVYCLRDSRGGEMAALYRDSFEQVWAGAIPLT